ncbi:serine/threonine-protein kinase [Streptomyces sp. NPDC059009]|uniref:serine/threonine-protein kinase n=1 Tax=Streptomyces sp. NPDC059009 TaxID=3346694 RepID=UPI0036A588C0
MTTGERAGTGGTEGKVIGGRYRLVERIGAGGMGSVWLGHDDLVDRDVAVKVAHLPELLSIEPAAQAARVERILREARAAARVRHPAIVTVHDVITDGGLPWIVMERIEGESLADLLAREGALSEPEAARIGLHVARALGAAHARGVLHRDVKPANVLLGADGRVVLTDFGIAYIEGDEPLTRSGEFVGSLEYTAPERMGGHRPAPPSDLWSLGVLLFRVLEGWSPFRRETLEGTVAAVLTAESVPVEKGRELGALVRKLLAKVPEERPSAEAVVEVLRMVAEPPAPAPAPAVLRTAEGAGARPRPRRPARDRRRVVPYAVVAAVLVAVAALTVRQLTDGDGSSPEGASDKPSVTHSPPAPHSPRPSQGKAKERAAAKGYRFVEESSFRIEVPDRWERHDRNSEGQYLFTGGDYRLTVVPGRDSADRYGKEPIKYLNEGEPELKPFRDSSWSSVTGLRQIETRGLTMAEGRYTWQEETGREVYVRNLAILSKGRYHLILVTGPESRRDAVNRVYERAMATYRER